MNRAKTILEQKLISLIERDGPITFRQFMHAALYDHDLGYYNTERLKIGTGGDYYTSSNVHPAFGAILARAFVKLWGEQSLTIVEVGAGTGQLAADLLAAMQEDHGDVFHKMNYVIVETSAAMRNRQQQALAAFGDRVQWRELQELQRKPIRGIIFSNELIDALPVHCVRNQSGGLEELYVTIKHEAEPRLTVKWAAPSTPELAAYIKRMGVSLAEGQMIEVGLDAIEWLAQISKAIEAGFLITIDYGDIAQHLYGPDRINGTLRSFYHHRLIASPLERVGEQDITASVNFTALIEYGKDSGFEMVSFERQSAFLIRMGLIDKIASMVDARADDLQDMKARLAVKNLFVPGGVSDNFRVLVQMKTHPRSD